MERSLGFYRDLLGLEVMHDFSGRDDRMCQVMGKSAVMRVLICKRYMKGW
jgi:catechol 2,3-dioxygenase-like lactoylglutathione lyase family enzyme